MSESLGEAVLQLRTEDAQLKRGLSLAEGVVRASAARMGQFLRRQLGAGMAAFAVKNVVDATIEGERAAKRLGVALKQAGAGERADEFDQIATSIEKITGLDDEKIKRMMSKALKLGAKPEELEAVTKAAIGLANVMGVDVEQATDDVIKAQRGQFMQLQRLIPELRNATTVEEKLALVRKKAAEGWELQKTAAEGLEGGVNAMKNAFDNLKQAIGGLIAKPLAQFFTDAAAAAESLTKGTKKNAMFLIDLQKIRIALDNQALILKYKLGIATENEKKQVEAVAKQVQELNQQQQKLQADEVNEVFRVENKKAEIKVNADVEAAKKKDKIRKEERREEDRHVNDLQDIWRRAQEKAQRGEVDIVPEEKKKPWSLPSSTPSQREQNPLDPVKVVDQDKVIELLGRINQNLRYINTGRFN